MTTPSGQPKQSDRIAALTVEARRDPVAFRRDLQRLMRMGTLYVYGVLAFLVAIFVGSVVSIPAGGGLAAVFLLWITGGMAFFVFRSMATWAKPPQGVPLKRSEVPALFELIDRARKEAGLHSIHRILVDDQFNASVAFVKSRGLFGKQQNYLVVGLPLMHALPVDEFHAVVAHECAHLSDRQKFDLVGMMRLQNIWQNVAINMMQGDAFGGFLFRPFFRWFLPRFIDRSLVFRRELELDADHHGMAQTGAETAARLEIRLAVAGLRLAERFGEHVVQLLAEHDAPPVGLTADKCAIAAAPLTDADQRWLALALANTTGWRDSHPALRDRLATYGISAAEASLPGFVGRSAADELLGDQTGVLATQLDEASRALLAGVWLHRHQVVSKDMEALRYIEHDARFGTLDDDDRKKRALLLAQYRPSEAEFAQSELEALVDVDVETNPVVLYTLGRLRLRRGDDSGVRLLERAAQLEPLLKATSQYEVGAFHAAEGHHEEAEVALRAASDAQAGSAQAQIERSVVTDGMAVEAHGCEEHELYALRDALAREDHVAEAWLARKTLSQEGSKAVYVLMVRDDLEGRAIFLGKARAKLFEELNKRVAMEGDVLVVPLVEPLYALWQRMRKSDHSQVYLKRGEEPWA